MNQGEIQKGQTLGHGREAALQGGLGTSGQTSTVMAMAQDGSGWNTVLPTGAGSGNTLRTVRRLEDSGAGLHSLCMSCLGLSQGMCCSGS